MWYVIQTMTGREERLKKEIENMVPGELYERVVVPYSEGKRRYEGAWHTERTILFPGYVFFVTEDIVAAIPSVRKVYQRVKLLGDGEEIYPLYKEEEEILSRLCGSGEDAWDDDLIGMSYGFQEGETITVTDGPLQGLEGKILKIDRHKREAKVSMEILGDRRVITLGLEVVKREQCN